MEIKRLLPIKVEFEGYKTERFRWYLGKFIELADAIANVILAPFGYCVNWHILYSSHMTGWYSRKIY